MDILQSLGDQVGQDRDAQSRIKTLRARIDPEDLDPHLGIYGLLNPQEEFLFPFRLIFLDAEPDWMDPEWARDFGPMQVTRGEGQWHYIIRFTEDYARRLIKAASYPKIAISSLDRPLHIFGPLPMLTTDPIARLITIHGRPTPRAF